MFKTIQVAIREFTSTVATKGFVIGVLIAPLILTIAIVLIPKLMSNESPPVVGSIEVIDRTGWSSEDGSVSITQDLAQAYSPETLAAEAQTMRAAIEAQASKATDALGPAGDMAAKQAIEQQLGKIPQISITPVPADTDLDTLKPRLTTGGLDDGSLLAIVVIDPDAVVPGDEGLGSYELYLRENLDDRFEQPLRSKVKNAIIDARMAVAGQDRAEIARLMRVGPAKATIVTPEGEHASTGGEMNFMIAMGFMMLLWISVFTGGQYLMTTVIEEKSSRVMEVLLSAVSPKQLMTGKILGQMAVALSILAVYLTIGVVALDRFNFLYLIDMSELGLVIVFFFIAFFLIGTIMASIGSAVTEVREAQALITPVMIILIIPMMLWPALARNPNSTFAVVMSMIPPINPFVMVIRMGAPEPIPTWQIAASIAIGIVAVFVAIWATAKIFRIGVLMYGKPPNLRTLIKWVRMA